MKLTPAQTAALRAAVDGKDAWQAARNLHASRASNDAASRSASVTIQSLCRQGLLARNLHYGVAITEEGRTALPGSDPVALKYLLELVSTDVPLAVVKGWTWDERAAAEDWAGRLHLKASDNIIRVPPCPPHVEKYRNNAARRRVRIGKSVI